MINDVKILMLKGQKGDKGDKGDKGEDGQNYYDDSELRQMIADETLAREQADATLENTKADASDVTSLSNTVGGLSNDLERTTLNLQNLEVDYQQFKNNYDLFVGKLHGVQAEEIQINGTTDSSGLLEVSIANTYNHKPYILTNVSDTLANAYSFTVNSGTSGTIKIRVRSMSDNSAVTNVSINARAIIIGF